ncbi:Serine/threonine-protein kinase [Actinidia chinensis var. chinensis]|uniref:Serine/threonine-protein kinase n=1 Tax=Actinidia chinensis var. chinensis TaxID=1590841 RepID=A0A2R6QH93_ACTCC|nr:Serine/threonine-protein kinase [Actinidia chinensis var. chinensis]
MGCVTSKQAVSVTPALDHSGAIRDNAVFGSGRSRGSGLGEMEKKKRTESGLSGSELGESGRASSNGYGGESVSFRLGNLQKYVEGEQVAAGWPAWLSAVAGEAIHGWVPLNADSFEKLEKIGQGTYSSVFRARDLGTGRIVALKKVRFDNFEPESVRFMAREIMILRRLDHPNIIKLEGLISSRLSCSIYLVFEYMEHDISGLLSCPDIKFSEAQVKCYMKQLLSGLDHCHSRGVMHRDIKGANLLVNNEGVLKVADFGLANFCSSGPSGHRPPLTSRVVTLWYRPPELLLGSTDYGASVDLWSVGCVFAELLVGRPILQGRTEVEQLHKIFKLCGSPPDDYWKKSKLPHATLFKPQQPYESSLWETFKDLPKTSVNLIKTFLSVEPYKRGTASSALASEYFTTKPYACEPSSLPKYPPSKEIDAKHREEAQRKRPSGRVRGPEARSKLTRKPSGISKLAPAEVLPAQTQGVHKVDSSKVHNCKEVDTIACMEPPKPSINVLEEASHIKNASQGDVPYSGPLQVSGSSGFAWAKRRIDDLSLRSRSRSSSRSLIFEPSGALHPKKNSESKRDENAEVVHGTHTDSRDEDSYEIVKNAMLKHWSQLERPDSFDASDGYHSQELSLALYQREEMVTKRMSLVCQDQGDMVEFSGPLLPQSYRVDELLQRNERHIRQAVRRSWFQKGKKHGKGSNVTLRLEQVH